MECPRMAQIADVSEGLSPGGAPLLVVAVLADHRSKHRGFPLMLVDMRVEGERMLRASVTPMCYMNIRSIRKVKTTYSKTREMRGAVVPNSCWFAVELVANVKYMKERLVSDRSVKCPLPKRTGNGSPDFGKAVPAFHRPRLISANPASLMSSKRNIS
jgi:hypothetical protein